MPTEEDVVPLMEYMYGEPRDLRFKPGGTVRITDIPDFDAPVTNRLYMDGGSDTYVWDRADEVMVPAETVPATYDIVPDWLS
jgi:hypothetical protein